VLHPVPSPTPTFVGRDAELARLEGALERVGVALLVGVAGVGKSAIAYKLAASRAHVVYRRCGSNEPLATLVDDLRRQIAGEAVVELPDDDDRLADLARSLDARPSLLVLDDLDRPAPPVRARFRSREPPPARC
jgi:ATP-dependent Clp protease ATP-binding subunit ClpA